LPTETLKPLTVSFSQSAKKAKLLAQVEALQTELLHQVDTCVSYEEEDTCVSYEEEDTCVSYGEEDTCVSYEEEDTCVSYEEEDTCNTPYASLVW
jgi:hypothetical protein